MTWSVDLSKGQSWAFPSIRAQGPLNDCTAAGSVFAERCELAKIGVNVDLSVKFAYTEARAHNQTNGAQALQNDCGTNIDDVMWVLSNMGCCLQSSMPDDGLLQTTVADVAQCAEALHYGVLAHKSLPLTLASLRAALNAGHVVVITFPMYKSWQAAAPTTGIRLMPAKGDVAEFNHCEVLCGMDDGLQTLTTAGVWPVAMGNQGFYTMPYGLVTKKLLASATIITKAGPLKGAK